MIRLLADPRRHVKSPSEVERYNTNFDNQLFQVKLQPIYDLGDSNLRSTLIYSQRQDVLDAA